MIRKLYSLARRYISRLRSSEYLAPVGLSPLGTQYRNCKNTFYGLIVYSPENNISNVGLNWTTQWPPVLKKAPHRRSYTYYLKR